MQVGMCLSARNHKWVRMGQGWSAYTHSICVVYVKLHCIFFLLTIGKVWSVINSAAQFFRLRWSLGATLASYHSFICLQWTMDLLLDPQGASATLLAKGRQVKPIARKDVVALLRILSRTSDGVEWIWWLFTRLWSQKSLKQLEKGTEDHPKEMLSGYF